MKQIKVFVSSTFKDMQTERDALMYQVAPRVNNILKEHGIHVQFIDLRWGVDTDSCAEAEQDHHVLNRCIDEIRQSRPFFIGMLGNRYGWIPNEKTWNNTIQQLNPKEASHVKSLHQTPASVTELEIILGAMMDKQLLRRSLFLFRNLTKVDQSASTHKDFVDQDTVSQQKLGKLKVRIEDMMADQMLQKHIVEYDAAIDNSTIELDDTFSEQIVDFLVREITLHEIGNASSVNKNNVMDDVLALEEEFEQKHTTYFQGRMNTLQEIHHNISNGLDTVVVGHAGTGRSALVAKYKELIAAQTDSIVLSHYVELCTHNFSTDFMWRKWIYQMSYLVNMAPIPLELNYTVEELQAYFQDMITMADKPVVLIIDGLEQLTDIEHLATIHTQVPSAHLLCTIEGQYHTSLSALVQHKRFAPIALHEEITNEEILEIIQTFSRSYSKEISPIVIKALLEKHEENHHCAAQPIWLHSMLHQLIYFTAEDYAAIESIPASSPMEQIIRYQLSIIKQAQGYPESLFAQRFFNIPAHMEEVKLVVHILGMAPKGLYREDLTSMLSSIDIHATLAISNTISWFGDMIEEHAYDGRIMIAHSCLIGDILRKDMNIVNQLYDIYLNQIKKASDDDDEVNSLILDAFTDFTVKGQDVDFVPVLFDLEQPTYFRAVDRVYWLFTNNEEHVLAWLTKCLSTHPIITTHIISSLIRKMRALEEMSLADKLLSLAAEAINTEEFADGPLHDLRINMLVDYGVSCLARYNEKSDQEHEEHSTLNEAAMQVANTVLSCAMEEEESTHTPLRTQHRVLSFGYMAGVHNLEQINQEVLQHFLGKALQIGDTLIDNKQYDVVKQHCANHTSMYYLSNPSLEVDKIEEYDGYVQYYYSNHPRLPIKYEMLAARYTTSLLYQFLEATDLAETMQTFILDELSLLDQKHNFRMLDKLIAEVRQERAWQKGEVMSIVEIDEQELVNRDDFVRHMHYLMISQQDFQTLWAEASWSIEDRIGMGIWAYLHHYHEIAEFIYAYLNRFQEATKHAMPSVEWSFLGILSMYHDDGIDGSEIATLALNMNKLIQEEIYKDDGSTEFSADFILANRFISVFFGIMVPTNDETFGEIWSFVNTVISSQFLHSKRTMQVATLKYQEDQLLYGEAFMNIDAHTQHLALYEDIVNIFDRFTGTNNSHTIKDTIVYEETTERLSLIMKHFDHNFLDRYGYYQTHRKAYEVLSDCYSKLGKPTETLFYLQKNSHILYEVCQLHPDNMVLKRDYAISLDHIGNWLLQQHNDEENAYKYVKEAAPVFELLYKDNSHKHFDNYLVNQLLKYQLEISQHEDEEVLKEIVQKIYAQIALIKENPTDAFEPKTKVATFLDAIADAYYKLGQTSSMIAVLQEAQLLFKEVYVEKAEDGPALRDYLKSSFRMMHYLDNMEMLEKYIPVFLTEYNQIVTTAPQDMQVRTLRIWMMIQNKIIALLANPSIPRWQDFVERMKDITQVIYPHITQERSYVLTHWMQVLNTAYSQLDTANSIDELSQAAYTSYAAIFEIEFTLKKTLLDKSIYTWEELQIDTTQARGLKLGLLQQ